MLGRVIGGLALMVLTGLATSALHGLIEPRLPPGEWHVLVTSMFIFVVWPTLTWLLRGLAGPYLLEFFNLPWL
jgi:hypothetical protein